MLTEVKDLNGNVLTDPAWIEARKDIIKMKIPKGALIKFKCRITKYTKGLIDLENKKFGRVRLDYGFCQIHDIKIIK